jgi:hypothetical protein
MAFNALPWWWPMMAEAAPADPQISGNWILAVLGALGTLAAGFYGHAKGKSAQRFALEAPVPEVPFRKVDRPVSFDQHTSLEARVARIETHLDTIQRDQAMQYRQILEAGSERELRMTEVINHGLREVHARLDGLATTRPPSRR